MDRDDDDLEVEVCDPLPELVSPEFGMDNDDKLKVDFGDPVLEPVEPELRVTAEDLVDDLELDDELLLADERLLERVLEKLPILLEVNVLKVEGRLDVEFVTRAWLRAKEPN